MARKFRVEGEISVKDAASATVRKVSSELDANAKASKRLTQQLEEGRITVQQYEAAQTTLVQSSEQLGKSLADTGTSASKAKVAEDALTKSTGDLGQEADKAQSSFAKFSSFLASKVVVTFGEVVRAARAAFNEIRRAADLQGQTNALKIQLAEQGQSLDVFLDKLKEVSRGTVSTADLVSASARALLLGIPATEIAELLEIARASSIATGTSVSQAFNDIAVGIGRSSPLILDNLGLVVKLGPAYEEMAKSLGKNAEQLTAAEQKQAILNKVLAVGRLRVEAYGDAQDGLSEVMQQAAAAQDEFTIGAGKAAGLLGTVVARIVVDTARGYLFLAETILRARAEFNKWTGDLDEEVSIRRQIVGITELQDKMIGLEGKLRDVQHQQWDNILGTTAGAGDAVAASLGKAGAAAGTLAVHGAAAATSLGALGIVLDNAGDLGTLKIEALKESLRTLGVTSNDQAEAVEKARTALEELGGSGVDRTIEKLTEAKTALEALGQFEISGDARTILVDTLRLLGDAADEAATKTTAAGEALEALGVVSSAEAAKEIENLVRVLDSLRQAEAAGLISAKDLAAAELATANAIRELAGSSESAKRQLDELAGKGTSTAASMVSLVDTLALLGFTEDKTAEKITKANEALEDAEFLYRSGELTLKQYDERVNFLNKSLATLSENASDSTEPFRELNEELRRGSNELGTIRSQADSAARSFSNLTTEAERARDSVQTFSGPGAGTQFFGGLGSGFRPGTRRILNTQTGQVTVIQPNSSLFGSP